MSASALPSHATGAGLPALGLGGLGLAAAGAWMGGTIPAEALLFSFVLLAGIVIGSLGLLAVGHLMKEEWLAPVRSEAEAAALTAPALLVLALPLLPVLGELFPWATLGGREVPQARAAFLTPSFFVARGASYLVVCSLLALWLARTAAPRRASAIALVLLVPAASFAGNDWVLSRDPSWWSSLFGFAFALSQLLAALAGAILVSLLRPEHPRPSRMQSLERALLTLALLTVWFWFVQFIVVWLANLPNEAAWYLVRVERHWLLTGVALPFLIAAVVILAPPGFGRKTMIAGSALLIIQHIAHMLWLMRVLPDVRGVLVIGGVVIAWMALFAALLQRRPTFQSELTDA
jgi:hypothetical protein